MRRVGGLFATLCLALVSGASAQVDGSAHRWQGQYVCLQGATALLLTITHRDTVNVEARFDFGPLPGNPSVPRGSFTMRGTVNLKTGAVMLLPGAWIARPPGWVMVGLDGRISGDRLAGRVTHAQGCSGFSLQRL
jgi:hypothetical protein